MNRIRGIAFWLAVVSSLTLCASVPAQDSKPAADGIGKTALPDAHQLISRVRANQYAVEQIAKNYVCILTQEMIDTDSKGREKKRNVRQFEVQYENGEPVQRLISENGKALTTEEQQKEDSHFQKLLRRAQQHLQEGNRDDKYDITISTFLRTSTFSSLRREGSMLVFDFMPNPEYKPETRAEGIANRLSGTVWIDESALQVVRLEARLVDDFKVGGGMIGSLRKGTTMSFEQSKINGEIWLPKVMDADYSMRVLFLGKHGHVKSTFSDYRRFRVQSVIKTDETE